MFRWNVIVAIKPYVQNKVTKRHLLYYGEALVFAVIRSKDYLDFQTNRSYNKLGKKCFKRVTYPTFFDIKRAYFLWTTKGDIK